MDREEKGRIAQRQPDVRYPYVARDSLPTCQRSRPGSRQWLPVDANLLMDRKRDDADWRAGIEKAALDRRYGFVGFKDKV